MSGFRRRQQDRIPDVAAAGVLAPPGKSTRAGQQAPIQRRAAKESASTAGAASGAGSPLPDGLRDQMGGAFGFSFDAVRVHEGAEAPAMGAQAYTQGTDLHFAPGEYDPSSTSGQELIGHELAHVVQQAEGRVGTTTQYKGAGLNGDHGLEQEADDRGKRAARGQPVVAGVADWAIEVDPESVSMGVVAMGDEQLSAVIVHNHSEQSQHMSSIEVDHPDFHVEVSGSGELAGGGTGVVVVRFTPVQSAGPARGIATINMSDGRQVRFTVDGVGFGPTDPRGLDEQTESELPELDIAPEQAVLPVTALGARSTTSVTIINRGETAIWLDSVDVLENPAFTVELDGSNAIEPGAAVTALITFAPIAIGRASGGVTVLTQDGTGFTFSVEGTGDVEPTPGLAAADHEPGDHAANATEARAMLLKAADSLSALAPSYQAQAPAMRASAELFVDECAGAASDFNASLVHWLTAESAFKLGALEADNAQDFADFVIGGLASVNSVVGAVVSAAMLARDVMVASATNAQIDQGLGENAFLDGMLARHAAGVTGAVVRGMAGELGDFGVAEGKLSTTADSAMPAMADIQGVLTDLDMKKAEEEYKQAKVLVDDYAARLDDLARALRSIASTRNQLTSELPATLAWMKDKYLEFLVAGGNTEQERSYWAHVTGSVSLEGEPPLAPGITTYPDQLRFGSVGEHVLDPRVAVGPSDMSSTMVAHASGKRPSELPGWEITFELALASSRDSMMRFRRGSDGSHQTEVTAEDSKELEKFGGVAEIWRRLEGSSLV